MELTPAESFNFIINFSLDNETRFKVLDDLRRLKVKLNILESMSLEEIDKEFPYDDQVASLEKWIARVYAISRSEQYKNVPITILRNIILNKENNNV